MKYNNFVKCLSQYTTCHKTLSPHLIFPIFLILYGCILVLGDLGVNKNPKLVLQIYNQKNYILIIQA